MAFVFLSLTYLLFSKAQSSSKSGLSFPHERLPSASAILSSPLCSVCINSEIIFSGHF